MVTATAAAAIGTTPTRAEDCCGIVELRQYDMKPNGRDVLIELFDRVFVDAQEPAGNAILGQFRDLDRPDRFVWLRGFKDMPARAKSLDAFYTSDIWKKHRDAANATMIDVSDVLLLHPMKPLARGKRPQDESSTGFVEIAIYAFTANIDAQTIARIDENLEAAGSKTIASYATEKSANNYPRLPIRENENVLVRIATFPTIAAYEEHRATLARAQLWLSLTQNLRGKLQAEPTILRLTPTSRSLTHG